MAELVQLAMIKRTGSRFLAICQIRALVLWTKLF